MLIIETMTDTTNYKMRDSIDRSKSNYDSNGYSKDSYYSGERHCERERRYSENKHYDGFEDDYHHYNR